ncbi:MAG: PRC-barrel domain-containing protein [Acidiferrobacterales bacterium]|nr:PRC-barrel domain-containing protein [Acidiferrobacterales bacterium]
MRNTNPQILSTSTLSGNDVINAKGEDLGTIKDFMLDIEDGNVVYAVLSFGGFMGFGDKLFALPWDALEVDEARECFRLNISKDQLKDAPGFNKDNWPSSPNTEFIDRVYTHYGFEPYSQRERRTVTA